MVSMSYSKIFKMVSVLRNKSSVGQACLFKRAGYINGLNLFCMFMNPNCISGHRHVKKDFQLVNTQQSYFMERGIPVHINQGCY